jgi:peptidylprolyl isomerase
MGYSQDLPSHSTLFLGAACGKFKPGQDQFSGVYQLGLHDIGPGHGKGGGADTQIEMPVALEALVMAQGGDPKGDGSGGSTLPDIAGEFTFRRGPAVPYAKVSVDSGLEDGFVHSVPVRGQNSDLAVMTADGKVNGWGLFCPASAGFARSSKPDSGNSQFFLMRGPKEELEKAYTVWGRVLVGQDVVKALKNGEPVANPDKMTTVRVASDLPAAEQPKVQVVDSGSAWVKNAAKYVTHTCDIDLPARVVN